MSNGYFWSGLYTALSRLTSARAEAVQAIFSAVEAGFNALPSPTALQSDAASYCDDIGVANAYVVTLPLAASQTALAAYTEGMHVPFKPLNTCTGPSTLSVNGLAPQPITHFDGTPLLPGDINGNGIADVRYDGVNFQLLNPWTYMGAQSPSSAAISAAASASSATASAGSATASSNSATNSANSATAAAASALAAQASLPPYIIQNAGIR